MNTNQIPPGIVAFKNNEGYKAKREDHRHMFYKEYVEWFLKSNCTIWAISVDGIEWTVGDDTNEGEIRRFYYVNNHWCAVFIAGKRAVSTLTKLPSKDSQKEEDPIIKANAEKGYIHLGSGEQFSLYRKNEHGIDVYYVDEGYDCGALTVWNSLRGPEILELILKDMKPTPSVPDKGEGEENLSDMYDNPLRDCMKEKAELGYELQSLKLSNSKLVAMLRHHHEYRMKHNYKYSDTGLFDLTEKALSSQDKTQSI